MQEITEEIWEEYRLPDRSLQLLKLHAYLFEKPLSERGARFLDLSQTLRPTRSRQVAAGLLAMASIL